MSDHELILGDCLDPLRGLATLASQSVDHFLCDPPYEAEAHTLQRRTTEFFRRGNGHEVSAAKLKPIGFDAITETVRMDAAAEMARVVRRWILVFCQAEAVAKWKEALEAAGATHRRAAIWVKPNGQPQLTGDRPGMGYESIECAHAPGKSRWNGGGKHGVYWYQVDTWLTKHNDGIERIHPTQKPLPLISQLVADFTDPGELICDPFAGSGTTLVACKRLGRRAIGWEKDATFWERAVRRLENTKQQYELLPRGPKPRQQKMVLP